jgi:succinoglycan biosynthesis protein ExoM
MGNQEAQPGELLSVCICTYKRPEGLRTALASVVAQVLPASARLEVVVVDNDPLASAQSAFNQVKAANPCVQLVYANVTTPGVSFARNRCLREASGDWIAFIDDDEVAPVNWLAALLNTAQVYGAGAVFGLVQPVYETELPDWLADGGGIERPRYSTGTEISWGDARTGNVLMTRRLAAAVGKFDTRFAKTGGEDSFFFATAMHLGFRLVWCDEATVSETVPMSRMTKKWIIQRAFFGGRTFVRLHAAIDGRLAYFKWFAHGMAMLALLALPTLLTWLLRRKGWLLQVRKLAGAAGKIVAPFYGAGEYGES